MTRYIDKEALIKFLDEKGYFKHAIYKSVIEDFPTADVVPKSEVEKAKQEVAREIFEEIENTLNQWIELYYTITVSTFDSIEQAKARASESVLRAFRDYIAELKKKFVPDKNVGHKTESVD